MAAAYVKVYVGDECFRTFGGNGSDVRRMQDWYLTAPYEEIHKIHPWMTLSKARSIHTLYSKPNKPTFKLGSRKRKF